MANQIQLLTLPQWPDCCPRRRPPQRTVSRPAWKASRLSTGLQPCGEADAQMAQEPRTHLPARPQAGLTQQGSPGSRHGLDGGVQPVTKAARRRRSKAAAPQGRWVGPARCRRLRLVSPAALSRGGCPRLHPCSPPLPSRQATPAVYGPAGMHRPPTCRRLPRFARGQRPMRLRTPRGWRHALRPHST